MDAATITETIALWEKEPQKAIGSPVVKARSDGAQAILQAGPFTWRVDLPAALGGKNEAPSPTALLLGALAGCAAAFIKDTLAPQLGVRLESVEATAQCKTDAKGLLGLEGAVPDLRDLELSINLESPDEEDKLQELYKTWQERCPVYLALIKPVPVSTSLSVNAQ